MKRHLIRSLLAGVALAGASATVTGPAAAAPAPAAPVAQSSAATTAAEQARVADYWTPERMASAKPADLRFATGPAATKPAKKSAKSTETATRATPQPQLGKVFFTLGGQNYVCSGTATTSGNADVVTTAGHCVHEGPGSFATNFAFVPAYDNGAQPYGKWTARSLYTTEQWAQSGDFNYDVGFAVMNETEGRSLTDVVGSYPIEFDLARGLEYTSYGYPAAQPFNGQLLYSCSGTASRDSVGGTTTHGLTCDMTGGSSGGGWITGGKLNSVNSFKYNHDGSTMYGPYFGDVVRSTYQTAATA
ncbi:hypothetical protein SAMN05421810_103255 [Amycolatopsis arida]|uniref:V8-like Glu-specific endopeptidase n=1 Tax=Amycolatopsis arida TaxID=587909 RepID=A0A1I5SSJ0_9PSEU|nr:hypothetical protein [Amycolatopsis arida]TDX96366.1 hypothetical protein CLV69_103503 [Amycolatopsis arida]SFP73713.1 hypothetical protein SAMN05421810_103255 [Amycolatopsis arida]